MACSWRIRHKLILGLSLVVAIMALLLGGTLHGLASYRALMGTCESKLEELKKAVILKEQIRLLYQCKSDDPQQLGNLRNRLPDIITALEDFKSKFKETLDRGRDPDHGRGERGFVIALDLDLKKLEQALLDEQNKPRANLIGERPDLLAVNTPVRMALDQFDTDAADLIGAINSDLYQRVSTSRDKARKSIMLLITTGILAVLLMAGLLRFFYRWVAQPIRDLEKGVSRVAQGDFEHRINIRSGDEIEDLAKAFNDMTDRLSAMYGNLAQQVNDRSRQLVRSERLAGVGFLAAGVAHEINNPLAAILFSSEALEGRLSDLLRNMHMSAADRETIAKYLKMIQEEAFRCKEITQKLLAFSRGGERTREETDLVEVIQGVLDMVQHLQNCKGRRIEFRPAGRLIAWVNAQEIKQVFLNLVINALESMEEGGTLTITHAMRNGQIELAFKDTGCGMTADVLENIFEPFFTRSRTGKGTGLGLSISHRIITQHGGEIEASSAGPGQGSTFRVSVPIQAASDAGEPGQDVQDPVEEFLKLSAAQRNAKAA